ncbi:flagellar basal body L-ring protein FlgH [Pseudaeromonas pectinilytica]
MNYSSHNAVLLAMICCLSFPVHSESFFNNNQVPSLVADNRAHQIGDTVTVIIVESTQATSQAGTDSDSNFNVNASSNDNVINNKVGVGYRSGNDDKAATSREGHFKGQIAVHVVNIDPQGLLKVQGHQSLVVNGEEQEINVEGYIRSIDIKADNTILSSRISEAKIELNGKGVVSDGQQPNIFSRLLSLIGL